MVTLAKDFKIVPSVYHEIHYEEGVYICNPKAKMGQIHRFMTSGLLMSHMEYFSLSYLVHRYRSLRDRMSESNRDNGWGISNLDKRLKGPSTTKRHHPLAHKT